MAMKFELSEEDRKIFEKALHLIEEIEEEFDIMGMYTKLEFCTQVKHHLKIVLDNFQKMNRKI